MAAKNDSFMNWFGRQIGHVKRAVTADVTRKPKAAALPKVDAAPTPSPAPRPQARQAAPTQQPPPAAAAQADAPKVIYRDEKAEEVELPDRPGVRLRRTVIDEVIVDEKSPGTGANPEENR